jgi:hypothetical protein
MTLKAIQSSPWEACVSRVFDRALHHTRYRRVLDLIVHKLKHEDLALTRRIREGRVQRQLAFVAGMSAVLSGWEVTLEHYRGSYGQKVMYTPVLLSPLLLAAGLWASRSRWAARYVLPLVSTAVLADGVVGFGYHVRGISRKPGGWRLPVMNLVTGPPLFAPLLFGVGGYLGLVASFMRRDEDPRRELLRRLSRPRSILPSILPRRFRSAGSWKEEIRAGRFQRHMAGATAAAALLSGAEALYSHYKNAFRYRVEWTPLIVAPVLAATAIGAIFKPKIARRLLPVASGLAIANGAIGFCYHVRGVKRRAGGSKHLLYNLLYGPPVFAPLLFAAAGFLGFLASRLRRE